MLASLAYQTPALPQIQTRAISILLDCANVMGDEDRMVGVTRAAYTYLFGLCSATYPVSSSNKNAPTVTHEPSKVANIVLLLLLPRIARTLRSYCHTSPSEEPYAFLMTAEDV